MQHSVDRASAVLTKVEGILKDLEAQPEDEDGISKFDFEGVTTDLDGLDLDALRILGDLQSFADAAASDATASGSVTELQRLFALVQEKVLQQVNNNSHAFRSATAWLEQAWTRSSCLSAMPCASCIMVSCQLAATLGPDSVACAVLAMLKGLLLLPVSESDLPEATDLPDLRALQCELLPLWQKLARSALPQATLWAVAFSVCVCVCRLNCNVCS